MSLAEAKCDSGPTVSIARNLTHRLGELRLG